MDAFDVQALSERQLLGAVLSQVLPSLTRFPIPGILPTLSLPLGLASSHFTSSSPTQPASLPSSSHPTSVIAPSSSLLSSTSPTSSTPLVPSVTPTPIPTVTPTPPTSTPIETVQAQQQTVTSIALQTASPSPTLAPSPPTTFLQNKVLSGVVFTICGVVALVLIFAIGTLALRTRRRLRNRRLDEIVSFDPVNHNRLGFDDEPGRGSIEKVGQSHSSSGHEYSSETHGPTAFTNGSRPGRPYFVPPITGMAPQQDGPGYSEFWNPPRTHDQRVPNVIPRIPPPAHLYDQPYNQS